MAQSNISKQSGGGRKFLFGLAIGAFCISYAPLFVKWVSLSPTTVAFYRCMFAVILLFPVVFARRGFSRPFPMKWAWIAGFAFSLDLVFWHYAIGQVGAGLGTLLANAQVFFLAFIGYRIAGERPKTTYWFFLGLAVIGILLLVSPGIYFSNSSDYFKGVVAGVLTGAFYSVFIVFLRKMAGREKGSIPVTSLFYAMLCCSTFLLIPMIAQGFRQLEFHQWIGLIGLAFLCQVVGWILITSSLPKVPVSFAGLLLLIQPVSSVIQSQFFFDEFLNPIQIAGGVLVLFSVYKGSTQSSG